MNSLRIGVFQRTPSRYDLQENNREENSWLGVYLSEDAGRTSNPTRCVTMFRQPTPDQIFVTLVDTYLDRIFRFLCNLIGNSELARDLCHEVFLKLRQQIERGNKPNEAYVFTTARNAAHSHWRTHARENSKHEAWGQQQAPHACTSAAVENNELRLALQTALAVLSDDQRTVFLLSEVEDLKYEQIGEVLNISAGTVASRKFKAVRVLREELRRLGHAMP